MKKNKLFVLLPALAIGGSLLLASCKQESGKLVSPSKDNGDNVGVNVNEPTVTNGVLNDDLSNLQAVTAMNLLNFDTSQISSLGARNITTLDRNRPISDEEKQEIVDLLPTLDLLMMEDQAFTSTIEETNETLNGKTYQYKEVISYKNNSMVDSKITLHFNILDSFHFDDDYMQKLDGVAILDNDPNFYSFSSLTKREFDDGEIEEERHFRIQTGENSYILVEEETENEWKEQESEFEYTIVENRRVVDNYKISIENEWNKKEVSYEVNEKEYEMKVVERNGEKLYLVEYENEEGRDEVEALLVFKKVIDENGNTTFVETTWF